MSKAEEVLSTVELLEMILLEVANERTVLLSQRVNKTFRDTIQGSTKLKTKLWLVPPKPLERDHKELSCTRKTHPECHPARPKHSRRLEHELRRTRHRARCSRKERALQAGFNPMFLTANKGGPRFIRCAFWLDIAMTPWALNSVEQSWHNMAFSRFSGSDIGVTVHVDLPSFKRGYTSDFRPDSTFKDIISYVKTKTDWVADWGAYVRRHDSSVGNPYRRIEGLTRQTVDDDLDEGIGMD